ncbi:MAG TPA: thioredoxin domain-containing protein [Fimbriimonadaceae bacterium]|nr:thioredoxin domain-containing protein [Fimbriimonadaceae bacterium]
MRTTAGLLAASAVASCAVVGIVARGLRPQELAVPMDPAALAETNVSELIPRDAIPTGDTSSKTTVVDISDLQCPYCKDEYWKLKTIAKEHHLRVVLLNYPLAIHGQAELAARLAQMAARRGKFWEFVEKCYSGSLFTADDYKSAALECGLQRAQLEADLARKDNASCLSVQRDKAVAERLHLLGVPTLILVGADGGKRYVTHDEL